MMPNDTQPTSAADEPAATPAAEGAAPVASPSAPPLRKRMWSTDEVWMLGAFSAIGLIGFIATFILLMVRSPNEPVQRTLTAAEVQRLTGPQGARGPAGPAGLRGDAGLRTLRNDCTAGNCTVECAGDEVLLTAYCSPGRTPAAYPTEQSALCRTTGRTKVEVVAVCLKDARR